MCSFSLKSDVVFKFCIAPGKHLKKGVLLNQPTTDQATSDHLLTNPPTHRPPTHFPTDAVIMFNRLENSKIFTLQNINTAGKI